VVTGISTYKKSPNKVVVPPDCCARCGNKLNSDWREDCPAKDFACSCGIKGHSRKYCYRDGKKRNPQSGGGKKTTKKDESESKEETSHGINENCFSLQVGPLKPPPYMPTIDQPEEVILASLQYSQGNDKCVNRAKDESTNKLHVLIKPMLEQWEQLQDDPSFIPTKTKMKKTQSAGIADQGESVL
jgi:hypothetical protein